MGGTGKAVGVGVGVLMVVVLVGGEEGKSCRLVWAMFADGEPDNVQSRGKESKEKKRNETKRNETKS